MTEGDLQATRQKKQLSLVILFERYIPYAN